MSTQLSAQHGAQRHHDHLLEIMALCKTGAWIGQYRESLNQHQVHLQRKMLE